MENVIKILIILVLFGCLYLIWTETNQGSGEQMQKPGNKGASTAKTARK